MYEFQTYLKQALLKEVRQAVLQIEKSLTNYCSKSFTKLYNKHM